MSTPAREPPLDYARLGLLCGVGFLVLASYSIARPPIESLYIGAYGRDRLPAVWLVGALAALLCVAVYNRYAARLSLASLMPGVCVVSVLVFLLAQLCVRAWPAAGPFLLYVWKDIYIVVLVEIFWSYANVVYPLRRARWLYGFFLLVGTAGSFAGNLGVGLLASDLGWGTETTLWLVVPVLLAAAGLVVVIRPADVGALPDTQPGGLRAGVELVRKSRYLALMVGLIGIAQIVITLVDYTYNGVLEQRFPDLDERTKVIGQVYAAIDVSSVVLQVASGFILRGLGAAGTLLLIPLALGATLAGWGALPIFWTLAAAKVASKAFDYSIFRAAKELLYLPLSYAEKTQGKAVVDILAYRVSKAGASLLLVGLGALGLAGVELPLSLGGIVLWLGLSYLLGRHYRSKLDAVASPAPADGPRSARASAAKRSP